MRTLQTAMGAMQAENNELREENERNTPLLDSFYNSISNPFSRTRKLVNLNNLAPSEKALEGLLTILLTMYSRPKELDNGHVLLNLFA